MKNLLMIFTISLGCATYVNADALDKVNEANPNWTPFQRLQDLYDHSDPAQFSQIPFVSDPAIKGTVCVTAGNDNKHPEYVDRKSAAIVRVLGRIVTPAYAGHPIIPADPGQPNPNGPLFPNVGGHPDWPADPPTPEKVEVFNGVTMVPSNIPLKKTEEEIGRALKKQQSILTYSPGVVQTYEFYEKPYKEKFKIKESYRISKDGLLTRLSEIEGHPVLTTYTYCFKQ